MASVSSISLDICSGKLYYRELVPDGDVRGTVLLLHGARFSSETWETLTTLKQLAGWKCRVVALDLPGYAKSKNCSLKKEDAHSEFISEVCQRLSITKPVLISPSMSGEFSLPYVIEHGDTMSGFIAIAPVGAGMYTAEQYHGVKVPTLIVNGDRDIKLGVSATQNLSAIPNSRTVIFEDAGHACYLEQPDFWHQQLQEFLSQIMS